MISSLPRTMILLLLFLCAQVAHPLQLLSGMRPPSTPPPATEPPILDSTTWRWKSQTIRYVKTPAEGKSLGSIVLIHGFGGNCDHWRRNLKPLASSGLDVYAIDLLGYGFSDKFNPKSFIDNDINSVNGETGENYEWI